MPVLVQALVVMELNRLAAPEVEDETLYGSYCWTSYHRLRLRVEQ